MSLPDCILYGETDFPLTPPIETPDRRGLDKVEQSFQSRDRSAYQVDASISGGRVSRFPGYNLMFIDKNRRSEEIPGMAYQNELVGLGLLEGAERYIPEPLQQPPEDFDSVTETVFTTEPDKYIVAMPHRDYPWLWIAETPPRVREIGTLWRLQVPYKGIVHQGLDGSGKPIAKDKTYRLTVNEQTVAFSQPTSLGSTQVPNGFVDENGTFNGWVNAYGQVSIPKVRIVETYLNIDGPPSHEIPRCLTPEFAPNVKQIFPSVFAQIPVLWNWPRGWSLIDVTGTPLVRSRIGELPMTRRTPWLCTNVYEFRQDFIPK